MYEINSTRYTLTSLISEKRRHLQFWTYRNNDCLDDLKLIFKYHNSDNLLGNKNLIKDLLSKNCINYNYKWSHQEEKDLYEMTERVQTGLKISTKNSNKH